MSPTKFLFVLLVGFVVPNFVFAQHERYELGRRLREFERAWEEQKDPAIRKKALADIPKVTNQFFSFQLGEAARTLDTARDILLKRDPTDEESWFRSLSVTTPALLIDAGVKTVDLTFKPFYRPKGRAPANLTIEARLADHKPSSEKHTPKKWPFTVAFDLEPLAGSVRDERIHTSAGDITVSRVKDLNARLTALMAAVAALPTPLETIEQATLKDHVEILSEVADGAIPENDNRFGDLMLLAELRVKETKPYFVPEAAGWKKTLVSFPTGVRKNTTVTRVDIPPAMSLKTPVPVVVALHGAGGSENLFVEGYGNGRVVEECRSRGWILVAPRAPGLAAIAPVTQLVEQLAARFPVDKSKVFLVGHSMGAAQVVELCQRHPSVFAGAAALGGGGRVRDAKPFANLPFYIGVGDKDFALPGAKGLRKALTDGGATKLAYKEYPDLEHMVIVREALPDVFKVFDAVVAKPN
jgi:predicted esterase